MTDIYGLISFQIIDADKEVTSLDVPFKNTTGLLADILAFIAALSPKLDAVIDGQQLRIRLSIGVPLPGSGIKTAPVTYSDNEKTGLFSVPTFAVSGSEPVYGLDVPSFAPAFFVNNQIDLTATEVIDFLAALGTGTDTTQIATREGVLMSVGTPKTAVKTFRKHRRALRRA